MFKIDVLYKLELFYTRVRAILLISIFILSSLYLYR